jgi:hypothetical protein
MGKRLLTPWKVMTTKAHLKGILETSKILSLDRGENTAPLPNLYFPDPMLNLSLRPHENSVPPEN